MKGLRFFIARSFIKWRLRKGNLLKTFDLLREQGAFPFQSSQFHILQSNFDEQWSDLKMIPEETSRFKDWFVIIK